MQGILLWMSLRIPQYLTRNLYWYHGQLNLEKQHAEPIHNPYKVEVNRERHIHGYGCSCHCPADPPTRPGSLCFRHHGRPHLLESDKRLLIQFSMQCGNMFIFRIKWIYACYLNQFQEANRQCSLFCYGSQIHTTPVLPLLWLHPKIILPGASPGRVE